MSLVTSCANMVPPTGGPKDTIPPVLIRANPDNGTTNFDPNRKTITLQFNEYVQLANLQTELFINPPPERSPEITGKLRNITIKLRDSLQANTTYVLQFGNAIQDINESNPFKDFTYAFSTGPHLDSLTLNGQVFDAQTGMPDSTLIILLHTSSDDSAVAKEKPRFATRPDGKGMFQFGFLPAGRFYLFALKDEGVKRYTSPQTMFAYYDRPVESGMPDSVFTLRAFVAEPEAPPKPKAVETPGTGRKRDDKALRVSTSASGGQVDLLDTLDLQFSQPVRIYDSLKLRLTDSNFTDLAGYRLQMDTTLRSMRFLYPWKPAEAYRLIIQRGFATDTTGAINPSSDTLALKAKKESEYGSVKVKVTGIDLARKPVLQWVQSGQVVKSFALPNGTWQANLYPPGEYRLRILYDDNGNGKWDTGDFWTKRQPEMILAIDRTFTVKPNWENEFEIAL